jgi:hypothetical protein
MAGPEERDDRFDRLDAVSREMAEVDHINLIDIEANKDETVATVDIEGVQVNAWHDDQGSLLVYSDNEGFEDPDDILDHVNTVASDDALNAIVDEVEWLRFQHGDDGVKDFLRHRRGEPD